MVDLDLIESLAAQDSDYAYWDTSYDDYLDPDVQDLIDLIESFRTKEDT